MKEPLFMARGVICSTCKAEVFAAGEGGRDGDQWYTGFVNG